MKMTIEIIGEMLKCEAKDYREKYDMAIRAKERELTELKENYLPGSKMYSERKEQIETACDTAIARIKVDAAEHNLRDIQTLRQQERQRVQTVDERLLAKIRAIENVPMTALELEAFADKIGAKGDYWANKMLSGIAEQNGIDSAEIGIESAYDVKMSILDQLTDQLSKVLTFYGSDDPDEEMKCKWVYLSDAVVGRAIRMYNGKVNKLSDEQIADRAYFTIATQHTDIQKGVAITNILRNASPEVKNKILCKLATDDSITNMAAELSGHVQEITAFKNGKATEYMEAEKALQSIRMMTDALSIEQVAQQHEDNTFFTEMFEKEKIQNGFLAELLGMEESGSEQEAV